MTNDELITFFQDGIVNDLMFALRHYFIWRTIGEHTLEIEKLSDKKKISLFYQLQSSSQELAVLNLAKIFDKEYKHFKTRSIYGLLSLQFQKSSYFPVETEAYNEFFYLHSYFGIDEIPLKFDEPAELIEYLVRICFCPPIYQKVKNLKYVRDKFIAHNEHEVKIDGLDFFWDDFLILTNYIKILVSLFGSTILNTTYFQFEFNKTTPIHYSVVHDLYWLVEEIENEIGKKNVKYWWND